jgi:hypothetical protein
MQFIGKIHSVFFREQTISRQMISALASNHTYQSFRATPAALTVRIEKAQARVMAHGS